MVLIGGIQIPSPSILLYIKNHAAEPCVWTGVINMMLCPKYCHFLPWFFYPVKMEAVRQLEVSHCFTTVYYYFVTTLNSIYMKVTSNCFIVLFQNISGCILSQNKHDFHTLFWYIKRRYDQHYWFDILSMLFKVLVLKLYLVPG